MKEWRKLLIPQETSIREAISKINQSASSAQTLFIVNEEEKLLGAVSDGDIRRALLAGISLGDSVKPVMNSSPCLATSAMTLKEISSLMSLRGIDAVPVVDSKQVVQNIICASDFKIQEKLDTPVVIMAGGVGSRLRPLTNELPKPMLKVGERPLLEITISLLIEQGFRDFFLSVNFQSEVIKSYFGDGSKWNARIRYLEEESVLGTAGSLRLLPDSIKDTFVVVNGDLLTTINYQTLIRWHAGQNSIATICTRLYDFQIPYGVIQSEGNKVTNIIEKPLQQVWVNAGIYVLDPVVLSKIPHNQHYDMTSLLEQLMLEKESVCSFPIGEYWLDIGHKNDLERANLDYVQHFK